MSEAPIFLTGFARSGTTWVNRILRDYFDAGFVNEGQFIVSFGLRITRYGDLRVGRNWNRLLRDLRSDPFFAILERNYPVRMDWQRIATGQRAFTTLVLDALAQIAEQTGKHRIGSKYPVFGRHLELLNALFPDCRVVHVIRDGRDCALSHRHMTWGHQNAYAAAVHWRNYLDKAQRGARAMSDRYLEIRYEDLLANPEATITALEKLITGASSGAITERFMRAAKPRPEKIAGWRQAMAPREQAVFEGAAGGVLQRLGYPLTGTGRALPWFERSLYTVHDRCSREAWHWVRRCVPTISEYK
jgi:hypothetical protein